MSAASHAHARIHAGALSLTLILTLGLGLACDPPECIDGPSNLTPEATASCEQPPEALDDQIESASAELLDDGTLILTWSSRGLGCGTHAGDVELPDECEWSGWVLSVEIPAELAEPGVITLAEHPEVRGVMTVAGSGGAGSRGTIGDEPFYVGELELVALGQGCVSGVLHGFGTGDPDPTLGGPELDGGFVAPFCDPGSE